MRRGWWARRDSNPRHLRCKWRNGLLTRVLRLSRCHSARSETHVAACQLAGCWQGRLPLPSEASPAPCRHRYRLPRMGDTSESRATPPPAPPPEEILDARAFGSPCLSFLIEVELLAGGRRTHQAEGVHVRRWRRHRAAARPEAECRPVGRPSRQTALLGWGGNGCGFNETKSIDRPRSPGGSGCGLSATKSTVTLGGNG